MTELIDIRNVSVRKDLSKERRVAEFIRQIGNPYRFKCGEFTVTARFVAGGPTLEDCLQRLMGYAYSQLGNTFWNRQGGRFPRAVVVWASEKK